ncbi:MAG: hypothetical protein Q7T56_19395 [Nocardioidaceae bacterium]|nr:hypothetical protein [Nocardioidaceae bacterium]
MPRWAVALLAALVTAAVVLLGVVVVRSATGSTVLGVSSEVIGCRRDESASGFQGYCVERAHRPELVVVPGVDEIHLWASYDGAPGGRYLSFGDPFTGDETDELAVVWTEDGGVRVTDTLGTQLLVPGARLERLGD